MGSIIGGSAPFSYMARANRVAIDRKPPRGAEDKVRAWASEGTNVKGIARSLGVSLETFNVWMDRHQSLRDAFEEGRETERKMLHSALYQLAVGGDKIAAMFLLKSRHGYREGDQSEQANRVNVTFNLPGAMPLDQFKKGRVIEHDPDA
ncbi:hypothetical protein [Solilutibacter silvestris]|uniref:Uncharacterized protein n=1 Tax=Solilutibacter silvestris TaxID=1645665 RepID=A0A2K1PYT6_9GAMM|nr:hypothetical protein [Lysobacter silvestris]PNS07837.1 hypothetical protein Lysil_2013 [Lysobacter silvestris]